MKGKLKNIRKGIARLALVGTIIGSSIVLSEKSGLTKAFVDYNSALSYVYYNADQKYPWLVWAHYGNSYTDTGKRKESYLARYRVGSDVGIGLVSGLSGLCMVEALKDRRYKRKFGEK